MKNKKVLLTCGDSFTFGSEIIDPKLAKTLPEPNKFQEMKDSNMSDYSPENDEYRVSKIWPTYLGKMANLEVFNISKPAISNRWIYNTTISWILENYINKGKSTDELMVIIGWTSTIRKEFFFNVNNQIVEKTLNPNGGFNQDMKEMLEFFKWYVLTTQTDYEGVYDFINLNFDLTTFCQKFGINMYCFNSLPEEHHVYQIERYFKDLNVPKYIDTFKHVETSWGRDLFKECELKWNYVLPSSYYQKDKPINSFSNYIRQLPLEKRLHGVHPSPTAHKLWAELLYEWIFNEKDFFMVNLTSNIPKSFIL